MTPVESDADVQRLKQPCHFILMEKAPQGQAAGV